MLRNRRDIGAQGEDFRPGGHNMVGRDIVPHLEEHRRVDGFGHRRGLGEGLDIGAADDFHRVHLRLAGGRHNHIVVDKEAIRHRNHRRLAQGAGVGEHPGQRGGRGGFGADEVNLRVGGAGTSLEIAVEGAQGHAARIRRLPHPDAGAAGAFQDPRARRNEIGQRPVFRQHVIHLLGSGRNGEGNVGMHRLSLQDSRHLHHVHKRGIGAGADAALIDFHPFQLFHRPDRVGGMGAGGQRAEGGEVNIDHLVVYRVVVRPDRHPVGLPALGAHEFTGDLVRREDGGRGAELRPHIGDGGAFRHRQGLDSFAAVFDDFAHAPLDREPAEHLQDHVLGRYPGLQAAGQVDPHHLRHGDIVGAAAHGDRHIQPARAEREHADAAAGGGMAVRADQGLTRDAEPLQMHLMADAVAGAGEIQAVLFAYRLDIPVVVSVFKAGLQGVVIDIRNRTLRPDAGDAHRLKLQIGHRPGGVLGQGLINPQPDFIAGAGHIPIHQMGFD